EERHPSPKLQSTPTVPVQSNTVQQLHLKKSDAISIPCAVSRFANQRIAVYTAVTSGYDDLKDPETLPITCDFIVFSEQDLDLRIWQTRPMPMFDSDPTRRARFVKTHPHLLLKDYDVSIWIDANVAVIGNLTELLGYLDDDTFAATWKHPCRNAVREEVAACE